MTTIDYFVRLLARFWAVPLFLLLIVCLLALRFAPRLGARLGVPGMVFFGFLICAVGIAIAPAAVRGGIALTQVLRAAMSIPPMISGPHAVATTIVALAPDANGGHASPGPINLQLWYPADAPPAPAEAQNGPIACSRLDAVMRLPGTQQPYRFILFAPSLFGRADQASLLMRSFASHGYVVAAFDDPAVAAPLPGASAEDERARLLDFDVSTESKYHATLRFGALRVEREAAMALDALDRLEACIQTNPALRDVIDFQRIGFVGYSFGGATAAEASFMDRRIAAVVNMDGAQFGRSGDIPVNVPYFVFSSGYYWVPPIDPNSARRYELMLDQRAVRVIAEQLKRPDSYAFLIQSSFHDSFADPVPTPRTLINWLFLDPYRAHTIVATYLLGFLDATLQGDRHGLIAPNDPRFPEVKTFPD